MKKLLLFGITLLSFGTAKSQCNELFFSEYVEGTNNNKALEIYNPTSSPFTIQANQYRIVRYNNGMDAATAEASSQTYVILGQHTITAYGTWVLVIDKRNPNGTGNELPVDLNLQAEADTFICPDYNISYAIYHNGNDALSLQKNVGGNWTFVDIFGEIGVDPGTSWSDCPPFYDASCGAYYTANQTLIRKATVQQGVTTNPSPFIAPAEWDSLPVNTFDRLGSHTCNCQPAGIKENAQYSQVKVYPNPASGNVLTYLSSDKKIVGVRFYNALGQFVKEIETSKSVKVTVEHNLSKGVYLSEIMFENGSKATEKLIVE